jgi:cytochrome c oxidase assembly protein subunit 17
MEAAKEGCAVPKDGPVGPDGKKLKPCCACPETKVPRDACIVEKVRSFVDLIPSQGEENCGDLIEAHKACMRALGFKI